MFTLLAYQILILGVLAVGVSVLLFIQKKRILAFIILLIGASSAGYASYLLFVLQPGAAAFLPEYLVAVPFLAVLAGANLSGKKTETKHVSKKSKVSTEHAEDVEASEPAASPQETVEEEVTPSVGAADPEKIEPVRKAPVTLPQRPTVNPDNKYKLPF